MRTTVGAQLIMPTPIPWITTRNPTPNPTDVPTTLPPTTNKPSHNPTHTPSHKPSHKPTQNPTAAPTFATSRCKRVCYKDGCKGTWSNPIPSGKQWTKVAKGVYTSSKGCCAFWSGACDTCCH